jgi:hypothetical protein
MPAAELQQQLAALVSAYAERLERGEDLPPFPEPTALTPTDVVRVASAMLEALDIEIFELALWRSWGGAA